MLDKPLSEVESQGNSEMIVLFTELSKELKSNYYDVQKFRGRKDIVDNAIYETDLPGSIIDMYILLSGLMFRSLRHAAFSVTNYNGEIIEFVKRLKKLADSIRADGTEEEKTILNEFVNFYKVQGVNFILAAAPDHPWRHETTNFDI